MVPLTESFTVSLSKLFDALALVDEALTNDLLPRSIVFSQASDLCKAFTDAYPSVEVDLHEKPAGLFLEFFLPTITLISAARALKSADLTVGISEQTDEAHAEKKDVSPNASTFGFLAEAPEEGRFFFNARKRDDGCVISAQIAAFESPSNLGKNVIALLVQPTLDNYVPFENALLMISLLFDSEKRKYRHLDGFNPLFGV